MRYEVEFVPDPNDQWLHWRWYIYEVSDGGTKREVAHADAITRLTAWPWIRYRIWRRRHKQHAKESGRGRHRQHRHVIGDSERTPIHRRRWHWGPPEDG